MKPDLIMKCVIPVVMAGIIAIYGLIVSVLIAGGLAKGTSYPLFKYVFFVQIQRGFFWGVFWDYNNQINFERLHSFSSALLEFRKEQCHVKF